MKLHPNDLSLQEFASTFPDVSERYLEHLIQCAECQAKLRLFLHPVPGTLARKVIKVDWPLRRGENYDPVLDRAGRRLSGLEAAYAAERAGAVALLSELMVHPPERQILLLRNNPRFHTWGLAELLLKRSREQNFRDAPLGESLALLALEVLDRLEHTDYGQESIEDLRARAWAYVANSRRVKADLRGAEEAFTLAFNYLRQGTRDLVEKAVLLDLKASLLRAQRRFHEAVRILRRAISTFLEVGEKHRGGRSLVKMSTIHHMAGNPEAAIPLLYQALDLIDPIREPRLVLAARHNLIDDLAEAGQFMEAQKLLVRARPLYQQFPQPWPQNARKWVEGKIARGLGQAAQAEALFLRARDGFLLEGAAYDLALVSLELASLYAAQGRVAELKRVAEEMVPIFSSRQIHREALAALSFWKQAVDAERAGVDLVTGVAAFLKRARHDPELRFERPE